MRKDAPTRNIYSCWMIVHSPKTRQLREKIKLDAKSYFLVRWFDNLTQIAVFEGRRPNFYLGNAEDQSPRCTAERFISLSPSFILVYVVSLLRSLERLAFLGESLFFFFSITGRKRNLSGAAAPVVSVAAFLLQPYCVFLVTLPVDNVKSGCSFRHALRKLPLSLLPPRRKGQTDSK